MNINGNNSISEQPVIGITMGDPAGIGPEIIAKDNKPLLGMDFLLPEICNFIPIDPTLSTV